MEPKKEYIFSMQRIAKELCHYIDQEPECLENCETEEPRGKKSVMVPVCKCARVYRNTMKEGTEDSWEFDDCKFRYGRDTLDRLLWAKYECPFFGEIFDSFWGTLTNHVYKELF